MLFGSTNGFALANVPAQAPAADFIPPAQTTAAITGTVHQDVVGAGDVTVTLSGPVTTTRTTDVSGLFAFTQLPPGEYKVSVPRLPAATDAAKPSIALAPTDIARVVSVNEARASAGLGPRAADGELTVEQFAAKIAAENAAAVAESAAPPPAT